MKTDSQALRGIGILAASGKNCPRVTENTRVALENSRQEEACEGEGERRKW